MPIQRLEQEASAKKALQTVLDQLTAITPDALIRAAELGTSLNFAEGRDAFDRTLRLFGDLKESNLDNVPLDVLNRLKNQTEQALNHFKQIQTFNPGSQSNPAQERNNLIQTVAVEYEKHFQNIAPLIAYSVRKGTDFEKLEETARNSVAQIEQAARHQKDQGEKHLADIKDTLEKVRRAAAEVGVAQHAVHFKEQAVEHINKTTAWLIVTTVFAVVTLGFGLYNAWYYATHVTMLTNAQSVQLGIAKLVVFSILYSAAFWSGRIYKSQWHNYIINKHRQNALSTFETFVKAATDDPTKNAVLLQATQCIFSMQQSGFVTHSDAPPSPQILEFIRGITGGGGRE